MELARYLNRALGTTLGPWDLDGIPEVTIAIIVEGLTLRDEMQREGLI